VHLLALPSTLFASSARSFLSPSLLLTLSTAQSALCWTSAATKHRLITAGQPRLNTVLHSSACLTLRSTSHQPDDSTVRIAPSKECLAASRMLIRPPLPHPHQTARALVSTCSRDLLPRVAPVDTSGTATMATAQAVALTVATVICIKRLWTRVPLDVTMGLPALPHRRPLLHRDCPWSRERPDLFAQDMHCEGTAPLPTTAHSPKCKSLGAFLWRL